MGNFIVTLFLSMLTFSSISKSDKNNNINNNISNSLQSHLPIIANTAFDTYLSNPQKCIQSKLASEQECYKLFNFVNRSQTLIYIGFDPNSKVYAILPDSSSIKSSSSHSAILVLDPYPNAPFGHLVGLFYLDFNLKGKEDCGEGTFIPEAATCLTLGHKVRCPNLLERQLVSLSTLDKRCHIDFLPTVLSSDRIDLPLQNDNNNTYEYNNYENLLECLELEGFAKCPKLRLRQDTDRVLCDAALVNTKRCDTSHATVGPTCKLFQTCDRGVLVGGGWNRHHSPETTLRNIQLMEQSLIKSGGFSPLNVKTFYANGRMIMTDSYQRGGGQGLKSGEYFSSAMKTALRGHLRTICEMKHCADTLFIYLNNPTSYEGDFLLWDLDGNGIGDELEMYTVQEFLSDIGGCGAKRVVILADQANTHVLMASLRTSREHGNVILMTGGMPNEVLDQGEFTKRWAHVLNPLSCIKHLYQVAGSQMTTSHPLLFDGTNGLSSRLSLVGAPCDLSPPVSRKELKTMYEACQNVPTSIWFSVDFEDVEQGLHETKPITTSHHRHHKSRRSRIKS